MARLVTIARCATPILLLAMTLLPRAAAASSVAPIVWVGIDDNIYYCSHDCAKPQCITCHPKGLQARANNIRLAVMQTQETAPQQSSQDTAYEWPTPSPDGKRIAYAWHRQSQTGGFGLSVYDLAKQQEIQLFKSADQRPIYMFWQPDGKQLSFLVAGQHQGLTLMVAAEMRAGAPLRVVTRGMPLYFDWNRTANKLVFHGGGTDPEDEQVAMMSISEGDQSVDRVLNNGFDPFKTPCWSPNGTRLAYVGVKNEHASLYVAAPDGTGSHAMVALPEGLTSFEWMPDSRRIVYSTSDKPPENVFDGLTLGDVATSKSRKLTNDPVLAYFISPNSRYIAYISVPANRPYYGWKLIDLSSGKTRSLGNFLTTQEESIAYRYFDQLALSHSIWSPESDAFVYAGVPLQGAPTGSLNLAPPPRVWIVPVGGAKPRSVAEGVLAFWSSAAPQ